LDDFLAKYLAAEFFCFFEAAATTAGAAKTSLLSLAAFGAAADKDSVAMEPGACC
jgi:hypothetical protein